MDLVTTISILGLSTFIKQVVSLNNFDLKIEADGDTEIDFHHTVEDVGITLGQAFDEALGSKKSITRYGASAIPFDETLSSSVIDLCSRPFFVFNVELSAVKVGEFDVELTKEFFQSFANNIKANVHIELKNLDVGIIESIFKSVARSLDLATSIDPRSDSIPSTKGNL